MILFAVFEVPINVHINAWFSPQSLQPKQWFVTQTSLYYFHCPPLMYHILLAEDWHLLLKTLKQTILHYVSDYSIQWNLWFYKQHGNANSTTEDADHLSTGAQTQGFLFLMTKSQNTILRVQFHRLLKLIFLRIAVNQLSEFQMKNS